MIKIYKIVLFYIFKPQMSEKKRGIIIAAMERYEKLLISNIGYLRNRLKCSLPIEIWQIGQEISDKAKEYLELKQNEWNFTFKDVSHYTDDPEHWKGYQVKPFILKNTKFEEVILCDCDSLFLTNPEVIFDDKHYIETGTYFFKDYLLHIPKDAQEERNRMKFMQTLMPKPSRYLPEDCYYLYNIPTKKQQLWFYQESGVVFLDKTRHPEVVDTIFKLNYNHKETYKYVHGDKETFWIAFLMHDKPFFMNEIPGLNFAPYFGMPRMIEEVKDGVEKSSLSFTHLYIKDNKYIPFFSQKAYPDYDHITSKKVFEQLSKCPYYAQLFIGENAYVPGF